MITYYLIYMRMFDNIMHGATDIMYGVVNIESVRNSKEKISLHPKVLKNCQVLEKRLSIYYFQKTNYLNLNQYTVGHSVTKCNTYPNALTYIEIIAIQCSAFCKVSCTIATSNNRVAQKFLANALRT